MWRLTLWFGLVCMDLEDPGGGTIVFLDGGSGCLKRHHGLTRRLKVSKPQAHDWFSTSSGSEGSDWGVWLIVDSVVGLFGWLIFGSAWDGVKSGVKRLLQLGAVLVACLAAHYAWAIAWPIVSCIIAVVMALVWVVRLVVKLVGLVAIACQRACGGAPEAYGAEFYGAGTGKVPETSRSMTLINGWC